jgi:hypothetical protein
MRTKEHLGDGVYVREDEGRGLVLTTENGIRETTNTIPLGPKVWRGLVAYAARASVRWGTTMRAVLVALALFAGALVLTKGRLDGFIDDVCLHARDCGQREVCVADGSQLRTGHCQRITVLP